MSQWSEPKDLDDFRRDFDRYEKPDPEPDVWVAEPLEDRAEAREAE